MGKKLKKADIIYLFLTLCNFYVPHWGKLVESISRWKENMIQLEKWDKAFPLWKMLTDDFLSGTYAVLWVLGAGSIVQFVLAAVYAAFAAKDENDYGKGFWLTFFAAVPLMLSLCLSPAFEAIFKNPYHQYGGEILLPMLVVMILFFVNIRGALMLGAWLKSEDKKFHAAYIAYMAVCATSAAIWYYSGGFVKDETQLLVFFAVLFIAVPAVYACFSSTEYLPDIIVKTAVLAYWAVVPSYFITAYQEAWASNGFAPNYAFIAEFFVVLGVFIGFLIRLIALDNIVSSKKVLRVTVIITAAVLFATVLKYRYVFGIRQSLTDFANIKAEDVAKVSVGTGNWYVTSSDPHDTAAFVKMLNEHKAVGMGAIPVDFDRYSHEHMVVKLYDENGGLILRISCHDGMVADLLSNANGTRKTVIFPKAYYSDEKDNFMWEYSNELRKSPHAEISQAYEYENNYDILFSQ